jgi:hypothetical protein
VLQGLTRLTEERSNRAQLVAAYVLDLLGDTRPIKVIVVDRSGGAEASFVVPTQGALMGPPFVARPSSRADTTNRKL